MSRANDIVYDSIVGNSIFSDKVRQILRSCPDERSRVLRIKSGWKESCSCYLHGGLQIEVITHILDDVDWQSLAERLGQDLSASSTEVRKVH